MRNGEKRSRERGKEEKKMRKGRKVMGKGRKQLRETANRYDRRENILNTVEISRYKATPKLKKQGTIT